MSVFQERYEHFLALVQKDFSDPIEFRPGGSISLKFDTTGVFDNGYVEIEGVQSLYPMAGIRSSDIIDEIGREPSQGDQILVDSTLYEIIKVKPNGRGDLQLVLHKVS